MFERQSVRVAVIIYFSSTDSNINPFKTFDLKNIAVAPVGPDVQEKRTVCR